MAPNTANASTQKKSKNQLRRERAKLLKQQANTTQPTTATEPVTAPTETPKDTLTPTEAPVETKEKVKVDDSAKVTKPKPKVRPRKSKLDIPVVDLDAKKPLTEEELASLQESYKSIFQMFDKPNEETTEEDEKPTTLADKKEIVLISEDDDENDEDEDEETALTRDALTKRKFKQLYSIPLSVLRSESKYPELIDWKDVNSPDPRLYIYLKSLTNSVYIPSHWQSKKSFLSSKRGIERPPFQLPQFILDTGILEMRNINDEAENETTLKQKMRERVQPKSGQLDIDYDKLHDAFFKYQKKPPLMKFGELYTETTNNEEFIMKDKVSQMKIGVLSNKLKFALGMIDEHNVVKNRLPPWYYKMQELGPPPSYPYMKIDKNGKISFNNPNELNIGPPIATKHWGTLINDLDEFNESKKKKAEKEAAKEENTGYDRAKGDVLLNTFGEDPTKNKSYAKKSTQPPASSNGRSKQLYTVLQNSSNTDSNSIFGSKTSSYKIPPQ